MTEFRLANYQSIEGPRAGIVAGDLLYDAARTIGQDAYTSTQALLDNWTEVEPLIGKMAAGLNGGGDPLDKTTLLAPLLFPGTIYCAGANYLDHMDAVAKHRGIPPQPNPRDLGIGPFFFLKSPRSVVGPSATVTNESNAFDYEIELAVVIGRKARSVTVADALDYVAGYTIANDMSARDRIMRTQLPDSSPFKFDWGSHKNFDGSCPLGPWIVPAALIADPQALTLRTWVNDELRQNSSTAKMLYSVAEQIEALSKYNTLYPGDVILTGTPEGVGAESSTWLKPGDRVRMEIGEIGEITTMIA